MNENYDLVLLDMNMGEGMDGLDTCREIMKKNPGQKIAVISGYSESERLKQLLDTGSILYMKKPYTIKALSKLAAESLKKPAPEINPQSRLNSELTGSGTSGTL